MPLFINTGASSDSRDAGYLGRVVPGRCRQPVRGRHQARERAVAPLNEAEARRPVRAGRKRSPTSSVILARPYRNANTLPTSTTWITAHAGTLDRLLAVDRAIASSVWELPIAVEAPEPPVVTDLQPSSCWELSTDDRRALVLGQVMLVISQLRAAAQGCVWG